MIDAIINVGSLRIMFKCSDNRFRNVSIYSQGFSIYTQAGKVTCSNTAFSVL
jgi:hypothetical protein